MPSPAFTFTGSVNKYQATAGGSVVATLTSLTGVSSVSWSIVGTDETSGTYTIATSGTLGSVATITAGAAGTAAILRCTINGGINGLGQLDTSYSTTRKWWVPATGTGLEVACVGENAESSAAFGWTGIVNSAVRNVASGGVSTVTASAPITSSGGASPNIAITAASSVAAGSMSAADKAKVDAILPSSLTADRVVITNGSGVLSATADVSGTQLNSATALSHLAVTQGGNPIATAGEVRLPQAFTVQARDFADAADATVLAFGAANADHVELGTSSYPTFVEGNTISLLSSSDLSIVSGNDLSIDGTNFVSIGIGGGAYVYVPGVTSGGTVAIAETIFSPLINQEDKITGNGETLTIAAQTSLGGNGNGGTLALAGGSPHGTGLKGGVRLSLDETSAEPMVEVAEVATGRRAVVLGLGAAVTATELPAGTGDRVLYIADSATAPTANPVSGQLLYAGGHALAARSPNGVTTDISPIGVSGGLTTKHYHHQHGRVRSTTNTFVTVATITIPASSVAMLTAYLVGKRTDVEGNCTMVFTYAAIKRTGSAAPVVSSTQTDFSHEDDNTTDWRWSVVGNDVALQAHGALAQTYEWDAQIVGNIGAI
jgi:carbon monoxide dehydrogenase subunit G